MEATRGTNRADRLYDNSLSLEGGMGAVAWAVLEMLRRGGMDEASVTKIHEQMNTYFAKPSNDECNDILRVVEKRLASDRKAANLWY